MALLVRTFEILGIAHVVTEPGERRSAEEEEHTRVGADRA